MARMFVERRKPVCCDHCAPTVDNVAMIRGDVAGIRADVTQTRIDVGSISAILTRLEPNVVVRAEFKPVRLLVYGFVSLVLGAVVLGGLAWVWPWTASAR